MNVIMIIITYIYFKNNMTLKNTFLKQFSLKLNKNYFNSKQKYETSNQMRIKIRKI